jgi:hypothetical protein
LVGRRRPRVSMLLDERRGKGLRQAVVKLTPQDEFRTPGRWRGQRPKKPVPHMETEMSWKSLGVLLAGVALATAAFCTNVRAQNDPFLGIWQLNGEKTSNYQQQSQMIINVPAPDGFTSIRCTIGGDNKSSTEVHPVAFDGKPHQTTGGDPREISYKRVDANTIERTQNRAGKISVDTEQVSKDGKTLTVKQANAVRVYDKQFNVQPVGH